MIIRTDYADYADFCAKDKQPNRSKVNLAMAIVDDILSFGHGLRIRLLQLGQSPYSRILRKCHSWIRANKAWCAMLVVVVVIALVPLYGILFPPLADLPQQILVNKLLWEKLSGVSHLDLEVSRFLGYRLPSVLMLVIITASKLSGISFVYLPRIVVMALIALHAITVVAILCGSLKKYSWKSCALAACFCVPAVVAMYSASWFVGFIGFTLGITLLIPAIFFTERFLGSGRLIHAAMVMLVLGMVYAAHPFALVFWLLWCFSRALAAIAMRSIPLEWKRLVLLGFLFLPIVLYHVSATRGSELAPSSEALRGQSPFVSVKDWYQIRVLGLVNGGYLKADETADSRAFALAAIGLVLLSTFLVFRSQGNQELKKAAVASLILVFVGSWVNEKFIPVPGGHWLAYDYRFSSAAYILVLAIAGIIFIRLLPDKTDRLRYRLAFVVLACISVLSSAAHLIEVRKAYARFDGQARQYMAKIFVHEEPMGVILPRSRWYLDTAFLRRYICLQQADCNPAGTLFQSLGGDIFGKVKSTNDLPPDALAN